MGFKKGNKPWNLGIFKRKKIAVCRDCSKEFGYYKDSHKGLYCSHSCQASSKNNYGKKENEEHWNWQGGKSKEVYTEKFNKELKKLIRNRYGNCCQKCGRTEMSYKRNLDVHHIDGNKKNCDPKNLIPLCRSCHIKIHNDRRKHGA